MVSVVRYSIYTTRYISNAMRVKKLLKDFNGFVFFISCEKIVVMGVMSMVVM